MLRIIAAIVFAIVIVAPACPCLQARESKVPTVDYLKETDAQFDARLAWWRQARFGMFIHWGPVSLKGTEIGWSRGTKIPRAEYDNLYKQFNPVKFSAKEWVLIAKDAGMKYIVITSKHHDGFSMFDSDYTDYDIMETPFGRDVIKELSEECRRQGIRFCTYYSILDWHHPHYQPYSHGGPGEALPDGQKPDFNVYLVFMKNQLAELIGKYGPLGILWFDGEWEKNWNAELGRDLYNYVRNLQPDIIINNRIGKGRHGMKGTTKGREYAGDYDTPEQRVGAFQADPPWETCMTICRQWAWKPNDNMKSLKQCLQTLIRTAGGDGNLLFNVGPMPDGRIEPRQTARLLEMGKWLTKYGASIYGTQGGPFKPGTWGASTRKDNRIYLHVFAFDGESIMLPAINKKIVNGSLLTGGKVKVRQTDIGIMIDVEKQYRQDIDTIVVLELDGDAGDIEPVSLP
ncbi:MAG: alpha-L-fucosidase [Planctomycetes bacterium]|nr:alpha-L-fucosidase [Planctomycetota bacterium]